MEFQFEVETWPIQGTFTISRGSKTEAHVIAVTLRGGGKEGRGECVPYKRNGETLESVQAQLADVRAVVEAGIGRDILQKTMPAGAARNAVDCALWDLEAKLRNTTIWELLDMQPVPVATAFTLSLDTPEKMATAAASAAQKYGLLKIKLGGEGDEERLQRIRDAAPSARLIIDANEGWSPENIQSMIKICEAVNVELIEQPLPVNADSALDAVETMIRICADESAHTSLDVEVLSERYDALNIKLDKTGGLTEALVMAKKAKEQGLSIMVGCMVSTSLSMAPATVIAQYADYADLDGPLLLARDREPAIEYVGGMILPTPPSLWG